MEGFPVELYCHWVKGFIYCRYLRHPADMAEPEINAFLTHLAVKEKGSAFTQNRAFFVSSLRPKGNCRPSSIRPACTTCLRRKRDRQAADRCGSLEEARVFIDTLAVVVLSG